MTLIGLRENGEGLSAKTGGVEHLEDFAHIVAIDNFGAPVESLETAAISFHVVAQWGGLTLTEAIDVNEGDEVARFVKASEIGGFPNAAFGAFTVSEEDIGPEIQGIERGAKGHAQTDAQPL